MADLFTADPGHFVEAVRSKKCEDAVRVWRNVRKEELLAATCIYCGSLTPAASLETYRRDPGGKRLRCRECSRLRQAARAKTPSYREKRREYEQIRSTDPRRREARREHARARAKRNRERSSSEVHEAQARLRPDGLKTCRKCREVLPLSEFRRSLRNDDGVSFECRACKGTYIALAAPSAERRDTWTRCVYCDAPAEHGDHVYPLARGGYDIAENLAPACAECNLSKSDRDLFDWRPDLYETVANWTCEVRVL